MADKIKGWLEKLDKYENAYYNKTPLIEDNIYDAFKDMIFRHLPPNHPRLSKIGHAVSSPWPKKKHKIAMGSQNKVSSVKEIREWIRKVLNDIGDKEVEFILQHKIDGFSLESCYLKGKIDSAQTRGDGQIGDNIVDNAKLFRQHPNILPIDNEIITRSEGVLFKEDFKFIQEDRKKEGKALYKNARNAASGISRRQDGKYSKFIRAIAYDINAKVSTEEEKIETLKKLGFFTVPSFLFKNEDEIINYYLEVKDKLRQQYSYDIDGLVLKLNSIELQERMGVKNNKPEGQVALKFDSDKVVTTVLKFKLQVGRTGRVTPVVMLEPVDLMGSTIKKASVHNFSLMAEIGIGVGAEVVIEKKGDIIPQVTEVMTEGDVFELPKKCPSCGGPLRNDGVNLWCFNDICRERDINRIVYWIKTVDMKGFSEKFVQKLWDMDKLRHVSDLYTLTEDDFLSMDGIGEKTIKNFFKTIKATSNMYLDRFITALGIPTCSKSTAEILVEKFQTWDKISSIVPSDLEVLPGFAKASSASVYNGISEIKNIADDLLKVIVIKEKKKGILTGKSFCVTGSLSAMGRKEFNELVVEYGGISKNSVSEGLSYLVTNDKNSGSGKNKKAKKYNIPIIDEEEFLEMIGGIKEKDIEKEENKDDFGIEIISENLF
jgi:DNA ligase (NAD+)